MLEFELEELSNMFNQVLRMLRAVRFQGEPVEECRNELLLKISDFFNEAVEIVESWGTRSSGSYAGTRAHASRESELSAGRSLHEAGSYGEHLTRHDKEKRLV